MKIRNLGFGPTALAFFVGALVAAAQGTAFTYQGRLQGGAGPATGIYDLRFTIHDAVTSGNPVGGAVTNVATVVSNGLFVAVLDFGSAVFTGPERWLEISVRTNGGGTFDTLTPRQKLTATPYAITAGNVTGPLGAGSLSGTYSNAITLSNAANQFAGTFTGNGGALSNVNALTLGGFSAGAFWRLNGNSVAPGQFLGSTNNQPVDVRVGGQRALRLEPTASGAPNVIGGAEANRVDAGIVGSVISGGGATNYFGGIAPNRVSANYSVIGGGIYNTVRGESSGIGSGTANTIQTNAIYSVIAGGLFNTIQPNAGLSIIGGGYNNVINDGVSYTNIGGGQFNTNAAGLSVIGGGQYNTIQPFGDMSVIGGGWLNRIESGADQSVIAGGNAGVIQSGARESFIGGGFANTIGTNAPGSFIGGGFGNTVPIGFATFIGGGTGNTNSGPSAFIGGGYQNRVENSDAVVGGGVFNLNAGYRGFIGGGEANVISNSAAHATIAGGSYNANSGGGAFIGGGIANRTENFDAVIAGGGGNVNAGYRAFIGGGEGNIISNSGSYMTIGGGRQNAVLGGASTIAGGSQNTIVAGAIGSAIGGGLENTNFGSQNVIGGGRNNLIEVRVIDSTVGGGVLNTVQSNALESTISGGRQNTIGANAQGSTISGGIFNDIEAIALRATIAGGEFQTIRAGSLGSTISGGSANVIESNVVIATLAGGQLNAVRTGARGATLSGGASNIVGGRFAVVPGGLFNSATGLFSFAAGVNASARHNGAFVWADSIGTDFPSTASNQFLIRASGGVGINTTNPTTALEVLGNVKAGGFMDNGSGFTGNGGGLTNVSAATLGGLRASNFWQLNGNNVAAGQFLGSTNNQAVEIKANGSRALRIEPTVSGSPNIIAGANVNAIAPGVSGATVGGGLMNMIGGGSGYAKVGGGQINVIDVDSYESTIGGGYRNTIQTFDSTIGGGASNTIETNSSYSTIAGGTANRIRNGAQLSSIGGGSGNVIENNARYSTIPGGVANSAGGQSSFAAGYRAKATHQGSFVWADSQDLDFTSGASNQFLIRAAGGVSINSTNPSAALRVGDTNTPDSQGIIRLASHSGTGPATRYWDIGVPEGNEDVTGKFYSFVIDDPQTGTAPEMVIRWDTGFIGMGTATPQQPLHLNVTTGEGMRIDSSAIGHAPAIYLNHTGFGGRNFRIASYYDGFFPGSFVIRDDTAGADRFSIGAGGSVRAEVGLGEKFSLGGNGNFEIDAPGVIAGRFIVTEGGNVGIGLPNPLYPLDVQAGQAVGRFTTANSVNGSVIELRNTGNAVFLGAINFNNSPGTTPGQIAYSTNNQITFRTAGATHMTLDAAGNLSISGVYSPSSDRNVKSGFEPVDSQAILEKVAALPIARWRYTNDIATPHIGAVAQDFYAAFRVGSDEKHISTVDADGVALAAIQGLNQKLEEKNSRISDLEKRLAVLEKLVVTLAERR